MTESVIGNSQTRGRASLVAGLSVGLAIGLAAFAAHAADTVESLLANPPRLAAVQQGCKTNQPWASDVLCRAAAEAIRRRFRGGGVPYTPKRVEPFPSKPPAPPAKPQGEHPALKAPSARPSNPIL